MPIPTPNKGEKQSNYIARCMRAIGNEEEHDRALAICYRQWREKKN